MTRLAARARSRYAKGLHVAYVRLVQLVQVAIKLTHSSAGLLRFARNDGTCHCEERSDEAIVIGHCF
jgi:hypothetical protein